MPDAPISLANNAAITDANQIGFTWQEGSNGGTAVLDWLVFYTLQETNSYELLESGVLTAAYTTTVSLQTDSLYKFKVQARNAVGISDFSSELVVRAARIPDVPTDVTTTADKIDVIMSRIFFTWTAPYDGGSAITSYTVLIQH